MAGIAELIEKILWRHYTENDSDETQLDRLRRYKQPQKSCYADFREGKARLYINGKNEAGANRLHYCAYNNTECVRFITREDLDKLMESENPYIFQKINAKTIARKTLDGGIKIAGCDIKRPSKVMSLDALEVEVIRAVL
ncbi:MAG: hypothetical protein PHC66_04735 [Candidatus Nanoarchaeia archaeon]|nr:hypothetical protein [Candidatus Nanoarchaeia archaeon]MDD5238991.1 hypothetical protein [Candidatus Nanoarchaeia archaeon]